MIRIAICDDDAMQLKKTALMINEYFNNHCELETFNTAASLFEKVKETRGFDIYLLDIIMPTMNGIELGKKLRELDDSAFIIYVTSETGYAIEAFKVHAYHYLLKPIKQQELFALLDDLCLKIKDTDSKYILVKTNDGVEKIDIEEINYVELLKRRLYYHLIDDTEIVSVSLHGSFKEANASLLEDERFVMCGASYVINLHQIKQITQEDINFNNHTTLEPPIRSLPTLKNQWYDYWFKVTK